MSETSERTDTPTADGCRRYPPDGFKNGLPCTCEGCADPCDGAFCDCEACYDGHEFQEHPTHHRPFMLACGIVAAVGLLGLLPLGAWLSSLVIPALVFFTMLAGVLIGTNRYCRHCTCPGCGSRLARDVRSPRGTNFYCCKPCRVIWESGIIST